MPINLDALLRYHTINNCLQQAHKHWTWEDLANACADYADEVAPRDTRAIPSKRTIQNDIKVMRSADLGYNAPIESKNGFYYYTDKDFSIRNATLNKTDVENISIAAKILGQYKGFDFFKDLNHVFESFESKVDLKFNKDVQEKIQFDTVKNIGGYQFLKPILNGISNKTVLEITYQKFTDDEPSVQVLHPYLLKEFDNRWYVLGHSEKRNHLVTLALDRVREVFSLNDHVFVENESFNPGSYFSDTIGVTYWGQKPENIVLKVDNDYAPYLITKPLHHSQRLISVDESYTRFVCKVVVNTELESLILSIITNVEILEPLSFKKRIADKLARALKKNS